jgi:hypothetical protein
MFFGAAPPSSTEQENTSIVPILAGQQTFQD